MHIALVVLAQAAAPPAPAPSLNAWQLVSWIQANWANISMTLMMVVAAASLLIKSIEKVVALLLTIFPGLKKADGSLKHVAAWLDAASKSKLLNTIALTPSETATTAAPPAPPASAAAPKVGIILAIGLAAALFWPATARAQCFGVENLHCGISSSLWEWRPALGDTPVSLGIGPEMHYHFQKWDLGAAALGNLSIPLLSGSPTRIEGTGSVFGCFGSDFGALHGVCVGPSLAFARAGLPFNWRDALGVAFSGNSDLIEWLAKARQTVAPAAQHVATDDSWVSELPPCDRTTIGYCIER